VTTGNDVKEDLATLDMIDQRIKIKVASVSSMSLRPPIRRDLITRDTDVAKLRCHLSEISLAEQEGLLDHEVLFPEKGRYACHEEVLQDMLKYTMWKWGKWESTVVGKTKEERKRSYRQFLGNSNPEYKFSVWRSQEGKVGELGEKQDWSPT
jgi:hypothetical protein